MFLTTEQLTDPTYAFEAGREFVDSVELGDISPTDNPEQYAEALHKIDPRAPDGLVRLQLEEDTEQYSGYAQALIMGTAQQLGILEFEYPFSENAEYDFILVCGGARNAILDRGRYAMQAVNAGVTTDQMLVAGSIHRELLDSEKTATVDWATMPVTEEDLAIAAAGVLRRENKYTSRDYSGPTIQFLDIQAKKADQTDVIREVILRHEIFKSRMGKIAVVTTALYVPFKTHDTLSVAKRYDIEADLVGVPSRPDIVAARKPKTYITEIIHTLVSAARHHATNKRLSRP